MNKQVVIFIGETALLLENLVRNDDGSIRHGDVVNGGWRYTHHEGQCSAADDNDRIIQRWPAPSNILQVEVPDDKRSNGLFWGDYNDIINWAKTQLI